MKIGDKVLCVNSCTTEWGYKCPKDGEIYTIRGFQQYPGKEQGVYLEELVNRPINTTMGVMENSFYHWRFIKWDVEEIEALVEAEIQHN
jgi:hypothetical protein